MTSHTNYAKKIWEETHHIGKLEVELKKLYGDKKIEKKWNEDHQRQVDILRAKSLSEQNNLVEEYENKCVELQSFYREKFEDLMTKNLQEEIDYIKKVNA